MWLPTVAIHRLGVVSRQPHILITVFARPTPVRSRFRARQQSQSPSDTAGKHPATSSPILKEAGASVRLSFQSRSLLLLADESSSVTVRMKLFRDLNMIAAGQCWNSWCLASVVCRVRSIRQATILLM